MKGVIKKTISVLSLATAICIVGICVGGVYKMITQPQEMKRENIAQLSRQSDGVEEIPLAREDMLEDALKSVVGISSADANTQNGEEMWYMGSGVVASEDGYIITNHHVIGARPMRVEVTLHNGRTIEGKTVWSDSALDLAVVKIDGKGYSYCPLGDAKTLRVGQSVAAIGNPLSMQFQRTVTAGIISAVGRSISVENEKGESFYMEDLIQTDASINPGNSGGPLLNKDGEVVGINTVKVSSAEGMGFAVPINVCIPVIDRLRRTGHFRTPYLGLYAYTPTAARYLGQDKEIKNGLFAAKLDTSGPAFSAGIRYGDIITAINGVKVNTMLELREELYKRQSGETVTIDFVRDETLHVVDVVLSKMP